MGYPSLEGTQQGRTTKRPRRIKTCPGGQSPNRTKENEHTHTRTGPGDDVLRPETRGVGVHTKQPRCIGLVPRRKTDGTGNRTCQ